MSDLLADIIFPTVVWRQELTYNNAKLKSFVKDLMSDSQGVHLSNYGGWQSESILGGLPIEFIELQTALDKAVKHICVQTELPPLKIDNLWFNVNPPGSYNTVHHHQDSVISGTYYIDVPTDNMGNIEFIRDDDSEYYLRDHNTKYGAQKEVYKAQTGVLLLFPSWLKHGVQGNRSDKNRISMAFNYGYR